MNREKLLIPFRYNNLEEILKDIKNNPKEFLYGVYGILRKYPDRVEYFNSRYGKRDTILRRLLYFIEKPFSKFVKLGFPLEVYLENRSSFKYAKTVLCINDPISLAMLFCKKIGFLKADIYCIIQSLSERRIKYFSRNRILIYLLSLLLKNAEKILVLSESAKDELHKTFKVNKEKLIVFRFGADKEFWNYNKLALADRKYILSVGNDINRDFYSLLKAVGQDYELVVISSKLYDLYYGRKTFFMKIKSVVKIILRYKMLPQLHNNVKIVKHVSNSDLKEYYHNARFIVTPSVKLRTESSGLSTTVQAMACGTPVLISDCSPMRESFEENKNILFYQPENVIDLQNKIQSLWENELLLSKLSKSGRALIEERYNIDNMTEQLRDILGLH